MVSGGVMVFPNPASSTLYFSGAPVQDSKAVLFSVSGRQVAEILLNGTNTLDVSSLPEGLYFYSIEGADGNVLKRGKVAIAK